MNWASGAGITLALAVILGAFGAHGLQGRLDDYQRSVYEKAVFYHFIHALGMLIVAIIPRTGTVPPAGMSTVCWLLLAGIIFFSGSLYILAVTGERWLGAITPIGGVCFIVGWLYLAWRLRTVL